MPVLDENHPVGPLRPWSATVPSRPVTRGRHITSRSEDEKAFFDKHLDEFERFLAEDACAPGGSKEVGAGATWHEPMAASEGR